MKFIYCEDKDTIDILIERYDLLLSTETGSYFLNSESEIKDIEFEQEKIIFTDSIVLGE